MFRFLIVSFAGAFLFSILVFSVLGIYMNRKSAKAISEIGETYMSGMNQQMSSHFDTVIGLRFAQVQGLVSVVNEDNPDREQLYEELTYRAKARNFTIWPFVRRRACLKPCMGSRYSLSIRSPL